MASVLSTYSPANLAHYYIEITGAERPPRRIAFVDGMLYVEPMLQSSTETDVTRANFDEVVEVYAPADDSGEIVRTLLLADSPLADLPLFVDVPEPRRVRRDTGAGAG